MSVKRKKIKNIILSTHRAREEKNRCIQRELQVVPEYSHFVECPVFCYIIENPMSTILSSSFFLSFSLVRSFVLSFFLILLVFSLKSKWNKETNKFQYEINFDKDDAYLWRWYMYRYWGGGGVTTCTTMINDHQNCIDSDILTMSNLYGRYWGLSISGVTEVIHIGQSQVIKGYVVCKVDKKKLIYTCTVFE